MIIFSNISTSNNINKNKSNPFFLYFAMQSVHSPSEAPQKYTDMNKNIPVFNASFVIYKQKCNQQIVVFMVE